MKRLGRSEFQVDWIYVVSSSFNENKKSITEKLVNPPEDLKINKRKSSDGDLMYMSKNGFLEYDLTIKIEDLGRSQIRTVAHTRISWLRSTGNFVRDIAYHTVGIYITFNIIYFIYTKIALGLEKKDPVLNFVIENRDEIAVLVFICQIFLVVWDVIRLCYNVRAARARTKHLMEKVLLWFASIEQSAKRSRI